MAKKPTKVTNYDDPTLSDPHWRDEYKYLSATGKSRIDGCKGIVTGVEWRLQSAPMVHIQRLPAYTKEGRLLDVMAVDIHMCDFTNLPKSDKYVKVEPFDTWLGDEVMDMVTGFIGIVVTVAAGINGCVDLVVVGKVKADGGKAETSVLNVKRWKVLEHAKVVLGPATQAYASAVNELTAGDPPQPFGPARLPYARDC